MRSLLAALAAIVLPCFAAVPAPAQAPAQEQAAGATVTVANMAFTPAKVGVGMGETVTWNFQDATTHTATSVPRGFFDTGTAASGASRTVRFPSAGVFDYPCRIHPMMRGKVRVPMTATGSAEDGWKLRWLVGDEPEGPHLRRPEAAEGGHDLVAVPEPDDDRVGPVRPRRGVLAGARPDHQGATSRRAGRRP